MFRASRHESARRVKMLPVLAFAGAALVACAAAALAAPLNVGSKRFTESYILGEIVRSHAGYAAVALLFGGPNRTHAL